MQLQVNGEMHTLSAVQCIDDVLRELGFDAKKIAVAVGGEFVPRSEYAQRVVNEGEQIDIVAPVQGG
jgi:sulfur carrier protein